MYRSLNPNMLGHRLGFTESCAAARKHGFKGVDIAGSELKELGASQVQDILESHDLVPGIVMLPIRYIGPEAILAGDLTGDFANTADAAYAAGYTRTTTVVMPGSNDRDFKTNWDFHVARLGSVAAALEFHGLRLGLEFIGPRTLRDTFRHPFLHTMDSVLGLAAALDCANVGLLVDLFHLYTSHTQLEDVGGLTNRDIVLVHLNDGQAGLGPDEQLDLVRDLPGANGVTDCAGLLRQLKSIDYDGPCSVEPFLQRLRDVTADEAIAETSTALGACWTEAGL